jgi:NAD(P)-dependent dehydrogenase (short-subunit alcohol dehydrogenase family)
MADRGFVLVTGASRGIGRSVALELARQGFSVFSGVRRAVDGEDLLRAASGDVRPLLLDVTNAESITAAEVEVRRATTGGKLSGLVNNAAVALFGPFEQTPLAAIDALFRVNVMGVVAVTQRFLPLLRQSLGRIVNISSVNGKLSFPFSSFYSASKFALEALSDALRAELLPWDINVSVVEPGTTRTDIRSQAALNWTECRGSLGPDERALYERAYMSLRDLLPQVDSGAADHLHVVEAVHHALTAESPNTRYLVGPDTQQWMETAALPDRERDAAFLKMFGISR